MDEEYLEAVLDVVELVPAGRVMTYGTVAEVVADVLVAGGGRARGGPRQVGTVLARAGSGVPWWRVVDASGRPPAAHAERALARLRAEATPLTADGRRVAVARALWWPDDDGAPAGASGGAVAPAATDTGAVAPDRPRGEPRGRPGDARPGDGAASGG